jgi:hypothetical protein
MQNLKIFLPSLFLTCYIEFGMKHIKYKSPLGTRRVFLKRVSVGIGSALGIGLTQKSLASYWATGIHADSATGKAAILSKCCK